MYNFYHFKSTLKNPFKTNKTQLCNIYKTDIKYKKQISWKYMVEKQMAQANSKYRTVVEAKLMSYKVDIKTEWNQK